MNGHTKSSNSISWLWHSTEVLSVDEPMGVVTRADGERLLVVGVKPKSQAADAGVRPGAYVTAVRVA
jgi:S1-C subfamily serine protease